ncbi:hypothetical protein CYFUS_001704 [Cystobacter fuscus]|uniref:Uncharacterized protein n=1 Tax=Cystobacter fuscus TaxID=43 RepID=A0A250IYF3_9BACT|nr:hypothetical protein [Cystobacter fuscus]ATB36290.1 hypothetical protein CYFUS_001704 [Cystobacter fuscus]
MKKLSTLTLTGQGTQALLEKGKLVLGKGRLMQGIRALMTVSIANASGTSRALTDAERQSFLDGYSLKLSYGKNGRRTPYNMLTLTRLQRIARFLYGSEWEGYTSTTMGLARTLTTGATTQVQLYVTIPTGRLWQLGAQRRLFGVGRTQAAGMQLELFRKVDVLPSGFTVSGNVTFDIIPDDYSKKGPEQWTYLPEWLEVDETDKVARLPRGCVLLAVERSSTLAASQLTDIAAFVDGEELYTNMSAAQAYTQVLDLPNQPAEGDISDRETVLYSITSDMELRDWLSGNFRVEQITKTLGTTRLGGLVIPIPEHGEVLADVADAAGKNGRNKTLKAVSAAAYYGIAGGELPHSLYPYLPMVLLDTDDKEFQRFPGLVSQGGGATDVYLPGSLIANGRAMYAQAMANQEPALAEDVVRQAALAVPGCVQDTHGLSRQGSPVLTSVRALLTA